MNNLLLSVGCLTVFVGTLFPLFAEAFGHKISVGPPFYNLTFVPLMIPLLFAIPFGPALAWKRGDLRGAAERLYFAVGMSILAIVVSYAVYYRGPWLAPLCIGLGVWLIAGAISEIAARIKLFRAPFAESMRRLGGLPRSALGTAVAHAGVGVMVVGIVAVSAWRVEKIIAVKPGESFDIAGYSLTFGGVKDAAGPNYRELIGTFEVSKGNGQITTIKPSKRAYPVEQQNTTEAGIYTSWGGDLYAVLGDKLDGDGFTVRAYFNPLVTLIWIGCIIMFIGGALSLSDRRLRVGAPKRAKTQASIQAAE